MFCCMLLCVRSSITIILMGKRQLVALLNLSSWCLVMVERLFLAVPQGCLRFVIVLFPDHAHYFWSNVHLSEMVSLMCRTHDSADSRSRSQLLAMGFIFEFGI